MTFIELLVTLAIVSILITLTFSGFKAAKTSMINANCVANLKQIAEAAILYAGEHNQFLPPSNSNPGESDVPYERDWYQYLYHRDLLHCDNAGVLPNPNYIANKANARSPYNCPANPDRIWTWSTPNYAYNSGLGLNARRSSLARISTPGKVILCVDAGIRNSSPLSPSYGSANVLYYATSYGGYFAWDKSISFDMHQGRAHFVMLDGHVESLNREQVEDRAADRTLLWSRNNESGTEAIW